MAKKDARGYLKFEEVYNYGYAAIGKLSQRYSESTDSDQRLALAAASSEIEQKLIEVRDAQIVHIKSANNDPVADLNKAIGQAKKELRDLEKLSKALAAAQRLLSLATRLISIVA